MDRMAFIPGPQAKAEIHDAAGHIFFDRKTALGYADEFIAKAPGGPNVLLFQTMAACMSEGEQVDIWFGLREPETDKGEEVDPSGELIGHTWATVRDVQGKERHLWEVGRRTPAASDRQAVRAFNAYRAAMAAAQGELPPDAIPTSASVAQEPAAQEPAEWNGKPVVSRALAPSNLYLASARTWYFVELSLSNDASDPAVLSRPLRAFDALILTALMTLVMSAPPLVFGIRCALGGLGKMPAGYTRTHFEEDEHVEAVDDRPLLVM